MRTPPSPPPRADVDDETLVAAYIAGFEAAFPEATLRATGRLGIEITFSTGSVATDGSTACLIATGVAGGEVTVRVVYPDGATTCS